METILEMVTSALVVWGTLGTAAADSNSLPQNQSIRSDEKCAEVDTFVGKLLARENPAEYIVWSMGDKYNPRKPPEEMPERAIDEQPDAVWAFISGICLRTRPFPRKIDICLRKALRWDPELRGPLGDADGVGKGFWGVEPFPAPSLRTSRDRLRVRALPEQIEVEWHRFSYIECAVVSQPRRVPFLVGVRLNTVKFFQAHPLRSEGSVSADPSPTTRNDDSQSDATRPQILVIHSVTQTPLSGERRSFSDRPGAIYMESEDNWLYAVVHVFQPEAMQSLSSFEVRTSKGILAGTLYAAMDVSGVPRWKDRRRAQQVNPFLRVAPPKLLRDRSDVLLAFKGNYDLPKDFYLCGPGIRLSLTTTDNP
jgi:hypothetical protein